MSSSTLKPCEDSAGAIASTVERRIVKKPLIGSLELDLEEEARDLRRPAAEHGHACAEKLSAEPPST